MVQALDYIHGNSIIHLDLKPANVMLRSRAEEFKVDTLLLIYIYILYIIDLLLIYMSYVIISVEAEVINYYYYYY